MRSLLSPHTNVSLRWSECPDGSVLSAFLPQRCTLIPGVAGDLKCDLFLKMYSQIPSSALLQSVSSLC